MNQKEISGYLAEKKIQLEQRIEAITKDLKTLRPQDFSEQTTESENDEVLNEIRHESEIELQQITEAIKRLDTQRYGICTSCQETISSDRLDALPYTATCINCAQ